MKKRILAILMAMVLLLPTCLTALAEEAEKPTSFHAFIALGGDKEAENDWGWGTAGEAAPAEGITATTAELEIGKAATISLEFATPVLNVWYCAPVIVAEGVNNVDFDIECKIDGNAVAVDMNADAKGQTWWYEGTGEYTEDQAVRLAGGYNEWATKYIEKPANFTKIEYTITLKSVEYGDPLPELTESTEKYEMFLAFGGAKGTDDDGNFDWGNSFDGGFVEGITPINATAQAGETVTIGLEFESPVLYTWYCAPCLIGENIYKIDYEMVCKVDGQEIALDMEAGKPMWYEATGEYTEEQCVRLAGGYNEWATKYIPESPKDFSKIEYEIKINKIFVSAESVKAPFDKEAAAQKDYNAYIQFQTDNYTFRDNWDNEKYGKETEDFKQITGWDTDNNKLELGGSFEDVQIVGNGTYTVKANIGELGLNGAASFRMLKISTDIPADFVNEGGLEITDVKTSFDGGEAKAYGYIEAKGDYVAIAVIDEYEAAVGTETIAYEMPAKSIEITFTIKGLAKDAEQGGETPGEDEPNQDATPTPTPAPTNTPAADKAEDKDDDSNTGLIVAIVAAVVAVLAGAGIAISKKKKSSK